MPSLKRGFLFQYFDKIICGVVGLVLLVGVAYALSRAGSLPKDMDAAYINEKAGIIEGKLKAPAPQLKVSLPNLSEIDKVPNPPAVRSNMAIPPLPVEYAPIKVGLNKEFILQFKAPLGEGSVTVQSLGEAPFIEIVQHPVDGDYSQAKVRSKSYEGEAAVVGYEGRVAHIYPVIVDASVNKTAYPPTVQVTSRPGAVSLKLVPDPKIEAEDVAVTYYEVWRRAWSDPLGKYEIVEELDPSGKPLMGAAGSAGGAPAAAAMPAPAAAPAPGARGGKPAPVEVPGIAWQDKTVKAGEYYSYKARTVGQNTFPTEGDYSEPVITEALADTDFKFALTSQDAVRFDVVTTSAPKASFWVGIGDEIGGVPRGTTSEDYLTKDVLVAFHSAAVQPGKTGQMSRVIYADETGNLRILWQGDTNSRSDVLWEKATPAPAAGGRAPFGPMGAGAPLGR